MCKVFSWRLESRFLPLTIYIYIYTCLSIYVCEVFSWRLESRSLPLTPHKYLYLWSDHHTKGVQWCIIFSLNLKQTQNLEFLSQPLFGLQENEGKKIIQLHWSPSKSNPDQTPKWKIHGNQPQSKPNTHLNQRPTNTQNQWTHL